MNLEDVHLRTTRALQPLATAVMTGTLCFITDEGVIEQSLAGIWESYSAAAVAGLNELTGDVTAGPGSGAQVATIGALKVVTGMLAAGAVTTSKITDAQVTEAKQVLADNTTQDVSTTKHGYAPKLSNDSDEYLDGTGAWSVPAGAGGSSEWDVTIIKAALQDVTNSVVFVDCIDFTIPVLAGEVWHFEMMLLYSADVVTSDIAFKFVVSAGVMCGAATAIGMGGSDAITDIVIGTASGAATAILAAGTNAVIATPRPLLFRGMFHFSANANFKFQFAQSSANPATSVRVHAGSKLRAKKII